MDLTPLSDNQKEAFQQLIEKIAVRNKKFTSREAENFQKLLENVRDCNNLQKIMEKLKETNVNFEVDGIVECFKEGENSRPTYYYYTSIIYDIFFSVSR